MKIELTYAEASSTHPDAVAQLVREIRATGNQGTARHPSEWRWRYEWAERITPPPETLEARIDSRVRDVVSPQLTASCYRTRRHFRFSSTPEPIRANIAERVEREFRMEQEYANLPASERARRAESARQALRNMELVEIVVLPPSDETDPSA